jgi:hypothetical protein
VKTQEIIKSTLKTTNRLGGGTHLSSQHSDTGARGSQVLGQSELHGNNLSQKTKGWDAAQW